MTIGWNSQTGITGLQTLQEKLADWQNQLRTGTYAISPNFTITTPAGVSELTPEQAWYGLIAQEIISTENTVALIFDQLSATTAEGVGLDALYSLLDLTRKSAQPSTVKVQMTGTPFAPLNNQLVLQEDTQQLFQFPAKFVIPDTGAAQTILTSIQNLPIQINAGNSNWTPVNPPNSAIFTITALEDSHVGNPLETDEAFVLRKSRELGVLSIATEPAIISAVSQVQGVASLNGEFNRSPVTSPSGVPGWYMEIVVEGGADLEIADAIDLFRHGEEATFGNVQITASSGRVVNFSRPSIVDVKMDFTIVNTGADVFLDADTRLAIASSIRSAVLTRINIDQGVGDDISPSAFNDIVISIMPAQSINMITILAAKLADPLSPGLVGITKRERARALAVNIVVSII